MIDLHLLGEILFKPFVLFNVLIDEPDCQLAVNLNGSFSCLAVVEPGFSPPSDTASVRIDTDESWNIETLDVNLKFCKRINESTTGYCFGIGFFFLLPDSYCSEISDA